MAVRYGRKISELSALNSASLQTYIVGVDNDVTYKISLDVLEDAVVNMVSSSTDARLDALEAYTSSGGNNLSLVSLNTFTQSVDSRLDILESNTSSYEIAVSPEDNKLAAFSGSNKLITTQIWDNGYTTVIGASAPSDPTNPEKFFVNGGEIGSFNLISGHATRDNYIQLNIKNFSSGETASADIVATNEIGDEYSHYIDMGINADGYNSPGGVGKSNDAYVYSTGNHLHIGNASNYPLEFFAGGMDSEVHRKFMIHPSNQHELTGSLAISGGAFIGNVYATNGIISSSAQITNFGFVSSSSTPLGTISGSSQLTSSFDARYALSGSGGTISTGTISGSSQLTASFDVRYSLSGSISTPTGTISSSQQITNLGFISSSISINSLNSFTSSYYVDSASLLNSIQNLQNNTSSYETTGRGILSGSISYNGLTNIPSGIVSGSSQLYSYFAQLNSNNSFVGNQTITGNLNVSNGISASSITVQTFYAVSSSVASTSGSTSFGSTNSDFMFVTGSLNVTNAISASTFTGLGNLSIYSSSVENKFISDRLRLSSLELSTSSYETKGRGIVSSSSQIISILTSLNTYTGSNDTKWITLQNITSSLISATSSYEIRGIGIISGSSQLTSSYDTRYTLSGSVGAVPSGTISGSSQLTSSFDARYALSGSGGGSVPVGTISGSSQLTSSFDLRYTLTSSFNSFTASAQAVTTGSNSFNGTQIITGSLIVTTGSFISSVITANTSSLYLTSGSNLYVQNGALVEITGSLKLSGSITISSGSVAMPNRPAFRVVGSGSTNIAATKTLSGSLASIDYNEGNYYNNTNGIFTAPIAGLYNVYFNGRVGNVNSQMQVIVYKNGNVVQLMWEASSNTSVVHFGVNSIIKLATNDTLEVKVAIGTIQFDANDSWGATYIG